MRTMLIKSMDELEAEGWKISYTEIDVSSGCNVELVKEGIQEVITEEMFEQLGSTLFIEGEKKGIGFYGIQSNEEEVDEDGFKDYKYDREKDGWLWPFETIKEITPDA